MLLGSSLHRPRCSRECSTKCVLRTLGEILVDGQGYGGSTQERQQAELKCTGFRMQLPLVRGFMQIP